MKPECAPPLNICLWKLKSKTSPKNFTILKQNQYLKKQRKLVSNLLHMSDHTIQHLLHSIQAVLLLNTLDDHPRYFTTPTTFFFPQILCRKNCQENCSKIQQCRAIYASFLLLSSWWKICSVLNVAWWQLRCPCQKSYCTKRKPQLVLGMRGWHF